MKQPLSFYYYNASLRYFVRWPCWATARSSPFSPSCGGVRKPAAREGAL